MRNNSPDKEGSHTRWWLAATHVVQYKTPPWRGAFCFEGLELGLAGRYQFSSICCADPANLFGFWPICHVWIGDVWQPPSESQPISHVAVFTQFLLY